MWLLMKSSAEVSAVLTSELRWMHSDYQGMGIDFPGKRFIKSFIVVLW